MKRIITVLIIMFFIIGAGFGQTVDNLLFFTGIGSGMNAYGVNKTTNELSIKEQVDIVYNHTKGGSPKVIVGHSQGGVRALGFASIYPTATAAVITIGAPVRGHAMLANPRETVRKIDAGIRTITRGVAAVLPGFGSLALAGFDVLGLGSPTRSLLTILGLVAPEKLDDVNVSNTAEIALNPGSRTGNPGLHDLSPTSSFMKDYIYPGTSPVYRTVRTQIGTRKIAKISSYKTVKFLFFSWKKPVYTYTPIYKTYQVFSGTTPVPKIPKDVFVHFITGSQNDPITLLENEDQKIARDTLDTSQGVLSLVSKAEAAAAVTMSFTGVALCATIGGIPEGLLLMASGVYFANLSADANKGAQYLKNYKENFGDILGNRENDSFIPLDAQSWDASLGGSPIVSSLSRDFLLNHAEQTDSEGLWGRGGSLDKKLITGGWLGYVSETLSQMRILPSGSSFQGK